MTRSYRLSVVFFGLAVGSPAGTYGAAADEPRARCAVPRYEEITPLDFSTLKSAFEQAGWPADHVRAILNAEIQRRLNPPQSPQSSDLSPFEYWHTGPDAQPLTQLNSRERRAERERREDAARREFDALFPAPSTDETAVLAAWEEQRRWGTMPLEKRRAVTSILEQAKRDRDSFERRRGGMLTTAERQHLGEMYRLARTKLEQTLTADELLDFDLRNSTTAEQMRTELDNFQPTKDEFLAIFKLCHPLELEFGYSVRGLDQQLDRRRADAEAAVEKHVAALLGDARYDDYRISRQPACQLLQFDGRYARVDASTVRQLYRALLAARANLARLAEFADAEKRAVEEKIKADLYRQYASVFDEEGARRYLQEQGMWP